MSKNINEIPFTELVERTIELARERPDTRPKIRAIVNDIYTREIPRKEDWSFFLMRSALTVSPEYITGNVSATTGDTVATFSSDATISADYTGYKLTMEGNSYVYDFTYSDSTGGTINPPLSGTVNASATSYHLFRPEYSLAWDFDRFPKNGGLVDYIGNTEQIIKESSFQDFHMDYSASPTDRPQYCKLVGKVDTAGKQLLEINPPPKSAKSYGYYYFNSPKVMKETTSGLAAIGASGVDVVGDSNTQFSQANTGDYFRIDAFGQGGDSEWYRIIAISGNSGLTLQTAFGLSGATSANYTICSAPQMPSKMHPAILYGSILQVAVDQEDALYQTYYIKLAEVLSDGKRLYKTRIYNQDIHTIAEEYLYRR